MGPEGANVLFDTWIHPLVMGLEEHLLGLFQDDFEFGDGATPSHRHNEAGGRVTAPSPEAPEASAAAASNGSRAAPVDTGLEAAATAAGSPSGPTWTPDAEQELKRIPFFVRKKARRNTERFAADQGIALIDVETLYEAKAHFGGR
jgi:light-independent protochlorophyllide reductase subunit B